MPDCVCTIPKSQGSEYPAVVIQLLTQQYAMLQPNQVYPGLICGTQLVVLVGQKNALAMAVNHHRGRRRHMNLEKCLFPPGCRRSPSPPAADWASVVGP